MPQPKLCLTARRLVRGLDKICCDFATCSPQAGLPLFDMKRRRLADLASSLNNTDMSMIGKGCWQKFGHSTCPSRGASENDLGSGVPYAILHGVEKAPVGGGPFRFTDPQGSFAITWQRRRLAWKSSTTLASRSAAVSNCLHPTSLASLGRAWGTALTAWTSRWNGVHH